MIAGNSPQDDTEGGSGGYVQPPSMTATGNRDRTTTRDIRLVEKLTRRRDWEISDVAFERLPNEILLIALNRTMDGGVADYPLRERLSAARTLAHMNRQNQANHPVPQQHEHAHVHATLGELIQRIEAQLEVAE